MEHRKPIIGDKVKLHPDSAFCCDRLGKLAQIGRVVSAEVIPGFGYAVKIRWPDEDPETAFRHAGHYCVQ